MRYLMILAFTLSIQAMAGDIKYPVSAIPDQLMKNASIVKRSERIEFEIEKMDETWYRRKVVLTILNSQAEGYASMVVHYDKLTKVILLEGNLYDAMGNLIRKAKNKDIQDYSAISDISLFEDNRMKVLDFNHHTYPYTVEFEVVTRMNNTYGFPDWYPQYYDKLAVVSSSYTMITPQDYTVRYKAFNYASDPEVVMEKNKKRMTWTVTNLPVVKRYFAAPVRQEITPTVLFSPSEFEMEGYKGNASNWQEFGKFSLALNSGRDALPDNIVQKVSELTSGISDEKEKVRKLYQFLQQNTRYISIQLGIGGLQPFEASFVAQKGYGDCKALSNYMYALLKTAGIRSYYSLINGGREMENKFLLEDFPNDYFNHIVLCVPFKSDTMWLECTSQTDPPGYMGSFTGNRKALLITEEGGKLVSTPRYGLKENTQLRAIKGKLMADGTLAMKASTVYNGVQQDELSYLVNKLSRENVKKYLQQELELATYEVNDFSYDLKRDMVPRLEEQLDITASNYATVSGKRIFIVPNILSRGGMMVSEDDRTVDFVFDHAYRNEDQIEIEIPEGYAVETAPQDITISNKYGTYSSTARLEGNKIIYKRIREQFSGRYPAKEQAEIIRFLTDIYKADRSRMVLVKKLEN